MKNRIIDIQRRLTKRGGARRNDDLSLPRLHQGTDVVRTYNDHDDLSFLKLRVAKYFCPITRGSWHLSSKLCFFVGVVSLDCGVIDLIIEDSPKGDLTIHLDGKTYSKDQLKAMGIDDSYRLNKILLNHKIMNEINNFLDKYEYKGV